jgi:nucleoside-diphosphate-sugar epimerase
MIRRFKVSLSSCTQHLPLLPRYRIAALVTCILSLLQTSDPKNDVLDPAIKGTTNILKAALKFPNVKRIVITSSIASILPIKQDDVIAASDHTFTGWLLPIVSGHRLNPCWSTEKDFPEATLDTPCADSFEIYCLSKILAERAAWDLLKSHPEATFDIITILPAFVFGPNLLQTSAMEITGTNRILWGILTKGLPFPMANGNVHVEDVARAHVLALDQGKVPGGNRYLIANRSIPWSFALGYAEGKWPERKWAEKETTGARINWDTSKAVTELGLGGFLSFQRQIDDVVGQMVTLGA